MDWTPLAKARDATIEGYRLDTLDMILLQLRCAKGHGGQMMHHLMGESFPTVQHAMQYAAGPLPAPKTCGECKSPYSRTHTFFASYLPMAEEDLWTCKAPEGTHVVARSMKNQVRAVSPKDPVLREVGPASHARALYLGARGDLDLPPGEADRLVAYLNPLNYPPAQAVGEYAREKASQPSKARGAKKA